MSKIINTKMKKEVVVCMSGGQDSSTCLFNAISQYGVENVAAVGFDYGQKHKIELECAKNICKIAGVPYEILDMGLLNQLTTNSLTRSDIKSELVEGGLPTSFVDGRNMIFLTFAAIYAKQLGAKRIITGTCETDFSGYPDCRDIFIKSLTVTLNLAMDYKFVIDTPLMWIDKKQTWELSDKLGVFDLIRHETTTCYNGVKGDGCGECPSCKLRLKGMNEYLESKKEEK